MSKVDEAMKVIADYIRFEDNFERMKNCMNCDHHEVCLIVARRKATKANDYSACSKWKLWDGDDI